MLLCLLSVKLLSYHSFIHFGFLCACHSEASCILVQSLEPERYQSTQSGTLGFQIHDIIL
jgi:hypothetical protein